MKTYNRDIVEAALCIWESVLETGGYMEAFPDIGDIGVAEAREHCIDLASPCHQAWALAHDEGEFDEPFDLEFVPWFLLYCVKSDGTLCPEWKDTTISKWCPELARRVAAQHKYKMLAERDELDLH